MANFEINDATKIESYYRNLYSQCGTVLEFSLSDQVSGLLADSHNFITDLGVWIEVLGTRTEVILLESALREYQYAILSLCLGHYRQAFASLRLFMELALATVQFSANELHLREWLADKRDINWQSLISPDEGVFSRRFAHAFFAEAENDLSGYSNIASQVYRGCSEFVHGNCTTQSALPEKLEFSEVTFSKWYDMAQQVRRVVLFALCIRHLKSLGCADMNKIEPSVMDQIGHISAIRAVFGGTIGG